MSTTPKPPSVRELRSLAQYSFDVDKGIVIGLYGKPVGNIAGDGYVRISIVSEKGQRGFRRCHLIFWAKHARWPTSELDHKDRNKLNDSWVNLEESNRVRNGGNRDMCDRNLPLGVHLRPRMKSRPYVATCRGKSLGFYKTPEEASRAYQQEINR